MNVAEQTVRDYINTIYDRPGVSHRMDVLKIVAAFRFAGQDRVPITDWIQPVAEIGFTPWRR